MTHGYSLRPNANGRRGRKSTDNQENISSTSTGSAGQGVADIVDEPEGRPVEADEGPANPQILPSAHKMAALPQDHGEQRLESWRQRGITSSSTMTTCKGGPTRYRVEGPPETSEAVQEGRRRVEAKHRIEAVRIQREQLERRYRQDLSGLHGRIAMLRHECEDEVASVRLEWERARAIDRGEAVEEAEEGEGESEAGEMECDEDRSQTEVDSACAPTETWSLNDHDHDHEYERRPTRAPHHSSWSHNHAGTSSNGSPFGNAQPAVLAPPPLQRLRRSSSLIAGPSSLGRSEAIEPSRRLSPGIQPLRRQPAQLMPIPFLGYDLGTATSDDGGRTEEDQDSEMGEM